MSKKQDVCKACGGYDFSLSDGFMYCDRCGTLLENFEELEDEDGGMHQTLGIAKVVTKKTKQDGKKRAPPVNLEQFASSKEARLKKGMEKRSEFLKKQVERKETLRHDASPDYLYSVGVRLASFTHIVSKSAFILVKELGFCRSVQKNALVVLQKYLAHCQVAFCDEEQCGDDEELRFVAVMENNKYEEEEREEKRRKKLARRGAGVGKLSKSAAAWQLLTQGNLTENLDVGSDEDEENEEDDMENEMDETNVGDETMGFVRKVTTALSKEAVHRASRMMMNLEVLVAVLHSAIMCSGYQEVGLADVVRWIREDRFRITRRSLKNLRVATADHPNTGGNRPTDHQLKYPLYEIQRTSTLFQQSIDLAPCQAPLSFEKLAARLIDNLNLPVDLLCRVLLLESIIPCDVSPGLRKQAKVRQSRTLSNLAACQVNEMTEKFMKCFGSKGRANRWGKLDEVLLSPETKLVAYILLALKLTFDIDHESVNSRIEEDDDEDEADETVTRHFTIDTWIHQLEMRIKCWQGHDMTMVLKPHCPVPEMRQRYPFGDNFLLKPPDQARKMHRLHRQLGFCQCIPSQMSFHSTANLPTVFDLRENRYRTERNRPEALMAPLKFQTVCLQREIDTGSDKYRLADQQSIKTFFRDFVNFKSSDVCETFDEFFPFSSCYESYTRPSYLSNCVERKKKKTPFTGPYRLYLSTQATEDIFSVASASFSPRFRFLLQSLSLIIGEDQQAVYSAFVMLETLLLNSESLNDMKNDLLTCTPIPIDGLLFHRKLQHKPVKFGIVASQAVKTLDELNDFLLSFRFSEHPELATEAEDIEFLKFSRNCHILETTNEPEKQESDYSPLIGHNFDKLLSILALKIW